MFSFFGSTWKGILPSEIQQKNTVKGVSVTTTHLGIKFPSAREISNGERDVICFIASLLKIEATLRDRNSIILIDEVFDTLDDANLMAVQYYLTKFIERFKDSEYGIYPIIFTHINPHYFKNFSFSKQKIHYLNEWVGVVDRGVENIVISRNLSSSGESYYEKLSSHYLHFHPDSIDFGQEMIASFCNYKLGKPNEKLHCSSDFKKLVLDYFDKYIDGTKAYDPVSVCIAARILIEKDIYYKLQPADQVEFLNQKGTSNKLKWAEENAGVNIPEIYYLLGVLYNELLHVKRNIDNASPIYLKLQNLTTKEILGKLNRDN